MTVLNFNQAEVVMYVVKACNTKDFVVCLPGEKAKLTQAYSGERLKSTEYL